MWGKGEWRGECGKEVFFCFSHLMEERPPVPRCSYVTGRVDASRAKTCTHAHNVPRGGGDGWEVSVSVSPSSTVRGTHTNLFLLPIGKWERDEKYI